MAEIQKKLKYRREGLTYAIDLYDSVADVGGDYISLRVDMQTVYAKLGDLSDEDASYLRVSKNGVTYSVLNVARQELPSGLIAIFDSACPPGWSRESTFDGYFVRGAAAFNLVPQGCAVHTHSFSPGSVDSSGPSITQDKIDTNNDCPLSSLGHSHSFSFHGTVSDSQSQLPPYINVVFCRKN